MSSQVTDLTWGQDTDQRFPRATHRFDYILAADVVYAHPFLDELMDTFDYLCQENTQILWAMRFRLDPENSFVDRFQQRFILEELYDLPSLNIKLYRAWRKDKTTKAHREAAAWTFEHTEYLILIVCVASCVKGLAGFHPPAARS